MRGPASWVHLACITFHAVISNEDEDGILKIFFFFGGFNKFLKTIISVCKCMELIKRFEPVFTQSISRHFSFYKISILFRDGEGPVIICSLNDGEKRFLSFFK